MRPRSAMTGFASLVALVLAIPAASCVVRDRTCASATECSQRFGDGLSCVAGRCMETPKDGGAPLRPAIMASSARHVVVRPTDVSYVVSGRDPTALPPAVLLGKDDARLFLRFDAPIAPEDEVLEAYLLIDRLDVMDVDPAPISLHAERILDPWDARSITWARQPRVEDDHGPATIVTVGARPLIRLDVSAFVKRWKRHDPTDQGLAIVAGSTNRSGIAFAAVDSTSGEVDPSDPSKPLWIPTAPRLELYLQRPVNASPAASSNGSAAGSVTTPSASQSARAPSPR